MLIVQSTCVELVWEQLKPDAPAVDEESIMTDVLETAITSVTRIVVLAMVEELASIGAVIMMFGAVASMTYVVGKEELLFPIQSAASIKRSPLEVMLTVQSTWVELVCEQLKPDVPAVDEGLTVTDVLETEIASVTRIVVLVMVEELDCVGAVITTVGAIPSRT